MAKFHPMRGLEAFKNEFKKNGGVKKPIHTSFTDVAPQLIGVIIRPLVVKIFPHRETMLFSCKCIYCRCKYMYKYMFP